MAVFDTTIVENIRKSVGNVTMYVNGGQQVVRKKAAVVKDRKSPAQLQQRERFKVVAALWPYIKPVAGRCFCSGTVRKAWNRFLRVNVSRVLVNGEQTDEENWKRMLVAEGPLVLPDMVAEIGMENREVVFRWRHQPDCPGCLYDDGLYGVIVDRDGGGTLFVELGQRDGPGKRRIGMPAGMQMERLVVYGLAINKTRTRTSNSMVLAGGYG